MKHTHLNTIAVQLTNVTKTYTIHHEKPTLVEKFIKGKEEKFTALNKINLTIHKGDRIGLIGPNGSGKTTLLKIISGITNPTAGDVKAYGKIVSLIDLEAGFHPDLTGIQNIFINGMLLGMKKNEIQGKLQHIMKFADIGKFIDIPLYTYSEGMKLRLGFSIAIYADPDIIILDEGLSVGDQIFQNRCKKYFEDYLSKKSTLIISLHVMDFIQQQCKRLIVMNKGRITYNGSTGYIKTYEKQK